MVDCFRQKSGRVFKSQLFNTRKLNFRQATLQKLCPLIVLMEYAFEFLDQRVALSIIFCWNLADYEFADCWTRCVHNEIVNAYLNSPGNYGRSCQAPLNVTKSACLGL